MDTSKKYIKMCEKAEEIQRRWEHIQGDFYFDGANKKVKNKNTTFKLAENYPCIWLPRQDQLQEMIGEEWWKILGDFVDYITSIHPSVESFEQLWLAFVMWEKYQKVWNDRRGEWVKKEK